MTNNEIELKPKFQSETREILMAKAAEAWRNRLGHEPGPDECVTSFFRIGRCDICTAEGWVSFIYPDQELCPKCLE
jgi:hypothetical protein